MFWLRDRQKRTLNQLHYVHFLKSKEVSFRHTFLAFSANHTAIKTTSAIPWCSNYMQRHKHRGYLLIVKQEFRQAKMTCSFSVFPDFAKRGEVVLCWIVNKTKNRTDLCSPRLLEGKYFFYFIGSLELQNMRCNGAIVHGTTLRYAEVTAPMAIPAV